MVFRGWWPAGIVVLAAGFVLIVDVQAGQPLVGVVLAAVLLVLAWVFSPLFFPRSAQLDVAEQAARGEQAPLIFWKAGCTYCLWMRAALGPAGRQASWIDVQQDEAAAGLVRAANGGDLTTPTVLFGSGTRTNPSPSWVRHLIRR